MVLLIALTIGAVLLIIIALLIFSSLDKSDKSSENDSTDIDITNIIKLKYKPRNVGEIQLFNSKYINLISSITVDGNNITNFTNKYIFNSTNEHNVELNIKNDIYTMEQMFKTCFDLVEIDLSEMKTKNIKNMAEMFYDCNSLTSINFGNFNTENVVNMSYLFNGCYYLNLANLINFNTSNVIDMKYMFSQCLSLKSLALNNFDMKNVKEIKGMFYKSRFMFYLDLGDNFITSKITDMSD